MTYPQFFYRYIEKQMNLSIPIPLIDLCRLAEIRRAGFYRWKTEAASADTDMEVRDEIQRIALEFSYYGSRRITRELHDPGWRAGEPQQVQRLMCEENLLCLPKRRLIRDHRFSSCSVDVSEPSLGKWCWRASQSWNGEEEHVL